MAKPTANRAAAVAIAVGHQVHGAIGFTLEYPLHLYTRRLMAWRSEFGSAMRYGRANSAPWLSRKDRRFGPGWRATGGSGAIFQSTSGVKPGCKPGQNRRFVGRTYNLSF